MQGNLNVKLLMSVACLAAPLCAARTAAAQQQAESQLLKILEARAESSGAFTARLRLTLLPGKDREVVARYYDWLARNIEKSHPDLNPQNSRLSAEILQAARAGQRPVRGLFRPGCSRHANRLPLAWRLG